MRVQKACSAMAAVLVLLLLSQVANAYLLGVDVSGNNGTINWTSLKTAKDFAIIKATEGVGWTDTPSFQNGRDGARGTGMLRGFYHFCRPDLGNSAVGEADWFVSVVQPLQAGEILMCDYEPGAPYVSDQVGWCKTWLDEVYSKTGIKPIIYLNGSQISSFDWSRVISAGYGLSWANWDNNPNPTTPIPAQWGHTTVKQYYDKAQGIPGIPSTYTDVDSFNGDTNAWLALGTGPLPTITTQPQSQTVCSGTNVTFTVAATGTGSITYQWRVGAQNISGATSTSYTTSVAGSYDCVVQGIWGSVTSSAATLTIRMPPSITTQPLTQQVGFGVKATFSVVATGTSLSYQWRRNGTSISGAINSTYQTANPGRYDCIVSNPCGSQTSSAGSLVINNATWVSTVAAAKALPDGTIVGLSQGPIVTRSMGSVWYIEDSNRACGLRVIPNNSTPYANTPPENNVATIYGSLTTVDGERVLGGALINNIADTTNLQPLAMTCNSAAEPLAQGLFARLCGKVTVPPDAYNSFTLNDGSATSFTVMLYGPPTPADGSYVNLRGVIGNESYGPVLRVNHSTDIW